MKTKISFSLLIICLMTLAACEEHYTPRPRGYFRIDLPAKEYVAYDTPCPLKTEIPTYSKVEVLNEGVDSICCQRSFRTQSLKGGHEISFPVHS